MTIFTLKDIPYVDINIADMYNLRFYKQADGNYSCTITNWMLPDLQEVVNKYNRKIELLKESK